MREATDVIRAQSALLNDQIKIARNETVTSDFLLFFIRFLFLEGIKCVKRHSHNDGGKAEAERDAEHSLSRGLKRIERALKVH